MRNIVLALSMASLVGCFTTRVVSTAAPRGNETEETTLYFVYGLTDAKVNASGCANGLSAVEFEFPWYYVFVRGLSGGLIDIGTTKYTCAAPAGGSGDSTPQAAK